MLDCRSWIVDCGLWEGFALAVDSSFSPTSDLWSLTSSISMIWPAPPQVGDAVELFEEDDERQFVL